MTAPATGFTAERWQRLCDALQVPAGSDARARFADIARAYAEPQRHYHTAQHIGECLAWLDDVAADLADAPLVELALWLHDVVYDPRASDNEAASARLARQWFAGALDDGRLDRLGRWIEATQHHLPAPHEPDLQALLDIDLAILAAPPARWDEYEAQVRREYGFVPGPLFTFNRRRFLRQLAARPALYGHPRFAVLEPVARARLTDG